MSSLRSIASRVLISAGSGVIGIAVIAACGAESPTPAGSPVITTAPGAASASVPPITTTLPPTTISDTVEQGPGTDQIGATPATDVDDAQPPSQSPPCGPRNLSRATVEAAIATIRTDGPGYSWVPRVGNYSTCNAISYIELETAQGTASSPWQLMIFDRAGKFLGTGIRCNAAFQTIVGSGSDHIEVNYRYIRGDEPNAAPSGSATVTFRWNGSRVVMDGALPYGVTNGKC